ncbi:hypothetical protein [Halopseudomonas aestusnigri]|uniref:hypothetical protein n=1 Tax=Halopseudomonas aestusnigri TaxID=857252 RepID=UPI0028C28503|nr:hypothetical protein YSKK_28200 [Halopseudomonas aestusnigri]
MNRDKELSLIVAEIRGFFASEGLSTSAAIARVTGVNQSQVYRNLFDSPKRFTKTHLRLCEYAKIDIQTEATDPRSSDILMRALASIWDGSDGHARKLADLLFAHSRASMGKLVNGKSLEEAAHARRKDSDNR